MKILPFFIKSILCPSAPFRYENEKLGNQQKQKSVIPRLRSYNRLIQYEPKNLSTNKSRNTSCGNNKHGTIQHYILFRVISRK